ncbi:MAG: hypothetical protein KAR44_14880 [Candidatus Aegiribacteria sp.]|nr:hypothetical protein [Candidatus Aegiribacteria sp.]
MKNPFKKRKKIEEEDRVEIKKREELISQYVLIAQTLQNEMRGFLMSKLSKYGLDSQKDWSFNTKTGIIEEVKNPQGPQLPIPTPELVPEKPIKKNKKSK